MLNVSKTKQVSIHEIYDQIEKGNNDVTYSDYFVSFVGICFSVALIVNFFKG